MGETARGPCDAFSMYRLSILFLLSEHYQRRLVKRLIFGHSSNADAELMMIEKLKSVCVYEFSSKIKRIYEDIKSSAAQQDEFNKKYKDNEQGKLVFTLNFGAHFQASISMSKSSRTAAGPFQRPYQISICPRVSNIASKILPISTRRKRDVNDGSSGSITTPRPMWKRVERNACTCSK